MPAGRIITGNTLKVPQFIEEAYHYGVRYFAVDSKVEIDKVAHYAPGTDIALRIAVDNTNSEWPLSKKFGAPTSRVLDLLRYAKDKGLNPNTLTFHVGSQCFDATSWSNALMTTAEIFSLAAREKIKIDIINMGGGFPSRLNKEIPSFQSIKQNINKSIKELFNHNDIQFYIEPGRGLVGEAAIYIATVIAKADRELEHWISLDIGVYNGLFEAVAGIQYEIISDKEFHNGLRTKIDAQHDHNSLPYNIAGPTCDSIDTIIKDYPMHKDIEIGDVVNILNVGAYTHCTASNFNGFGPPEVYFV